MYSKFFYIFLDHLVCMLPARARTAHPSNFQSALAKARPNDRLGLQEERRQVRIVIDVGIYLSMDQPPIVGGNGGPFTRGMRSIARARSHTCVSVRTIHGRV